MQQQQKAGTEETKSVEIYTALNHPVLLDVPKCQASESDTVEWDVGSAPQARRKKGPMYYNDCKSTCTLYQNGSLFLRRPKDKNTNYTLKVYMSGGILRCHISVMVILEEVVDQPVIDYNCTSNGAIIHCSASAGKLSNLTLFWSSKSKYTSDKSLTVNIREQKVVASCVAKNRVSQNSATRAVNCAGWDIYLIASVAGGAVALIIFIALAYYSVKYKPWRSRRRSEEDVGVNSLQTNTLQRQLPDPTSIGYLSSGGLGDFFDHGSIQKPLTPHRQEQEMAPGGRKEKQNRSPRRLPQAPGEIVKVYHSVPNPQQITPALPGNHPSEQAPRPQPRTKSKPPRQNRRT